MKSRKRENVNEESETGNGMRNRKQRKGMKSRKRENGNEESETGNRMKNREIGNKKPEPGSKIELQTVHRQIIKLKS